MTTIEQKAGKKTRNPFKTIPGYGYFFGVIIFGFQTLIFYSSRFFERDVSLHGIHISFATSIDKHIPLMPYFFLTIYIAWFALVPIGGIIAGHNNKKDGLNFMISGIIGIIVGGLLLAFVPTYFDESNVPGVPGGDIRVYIKNQISKTNGITGKILLGFHNKEYGRGLTPSFHCLSIFFCYLGVARRKEVHIGHRLGGLFIALLVAASTLFNKQHGFVDIFASAIVCLICFVLVRSFDPASAILKKCPNFLIIKKGNGTNEKYKMNKKGNKKGK